MQRLVIKNRFHEFKNGRHRAVKIKTKFRIAGIIHPEVILLITDIETQEVITRPFLRDKHDKKQQQNVTNGMI